MWRRFRDADEEQLTDSFTKTVAAVRQDASALVRRDPHWSVPQLPDDLPIRIKAIIPTTKVPFSLRVRDDTRESC